jgi:threonine aldolase
MSELTKAIASASSNPSQIAELELKASALLGKEAMYIPWHSAKYTLGLMSLCPKRTRFLVGDKSYYAKFEEGVEFYSAGAVFPRTFPNHPDGSVGLKNLAKAVKLPKDPDLPEYTGQVTVALENSHRVCGGRTLGPDYLESVGQYCTSNNLKLYLDGARLLDAFVAQKRSHPDLQLADLVKPFDAVTVFLGRSESWAAGSIVAGDAKTITKSKMYRHWLMKHGFKPDCFPECGLITLSKYEEWYTEDHGRADYLASEMKSCGFTVQPYDTNILDVSLESVSCEVLSSHLKSKGVLANPLYEDAQRLRVVTHSDLSYDDVKAAAQAFREVSTEIATKT